MPEPDSESIRAAMRDAWADHHHARNQTWHALQIEFFVVAGVVGANWLLNSAWGTVLSCFLVMVAALSGIQITLHHRNRVEIDKFRHIRHCEEALGLRRGDLIDGVTMPQPIKLWHALCPWKKNTALFILRMHLAIMAFALLFLGARLAKLI
jgi:hypothetical protein